jgi:hypothetical protein
MSCSLAAAFNAPEDKRRPREQLVLAIGQGFRCQGASPRAASVRGMAVSRRAAEGARLVLAPADVAWKNAPFASPAASRAGLVFSPSGTARSSGCGRVLLLIACHARPKSPRTRRTPPAAHRRPSCTTFRRHLPSRCEGRPRHEQTKDTTRMFDVVGAVRSRAARARHIRPRGTGGRPQSCGTPFTCSPSRSRPKSPLKSRQTE